MTTSCLSHSQLLAALTLRDLTNRNNGVHAMQQLIDEVQTALESLWPCYLQRQNTLPVVPVADNYDALGYPADGPSREARYSRYLNDSLMLRTQTSSAIPQWLSGWRGRRPDWLGTLCHGLVYRRDCIDRWHCAEPHQLDVWIVMPKQEVNESDILHEAISAVLGTLLPTHLRTITSSPHPYTKEGVQLDVIGEQGVLVEVGECGVIHPQVLERHGWSSGQYTGVAMGLGLDRILMLRKGIPDIRLLRDDDPRVQAQMKELSPWKRVSRQPAVTRDLSIAIEQDMDEEVVGDRVREVLGKDADWLEEVSVISSTSYDRLPQIAVERLGMKPGQSNLLLRLVIRHPSMSIPSEQANRIRNQVYLALHEGSNHMLA